MSDLCRHHTARGEPDICAEIECSIKEGWAYCRLKAEADAMRKDKEKPGGGGGGAA